MFCVRSKYIRVELAQNKCSPCSHKTVLTSGDQGKKEQESHAFDGPKYLLINLALTGKVSSRVAK